MSETVTVQAFLQSIDSFTVNPNNGSASQAITVPAPKNPDNPGTIRIWVPGSTLCYFKQGVTTPTAAATDTVLAPGVLNTLRLKQDTTSIAIYSTGNIVCSCTVGTGGLVA